MRKIVLSFLCVLLCMGCEKVVESPTYELQSFKSEVVVQTEKPTEYFVHDPVLPNYVSLIKYPKESLIDWNTATETVCRVNDELFFQFEKNESLRAIELQAEGIISLKLTFASGNEKILRLSPNQTLIDIGEKQLTDTLKIEVLELDSDQCLIQEFHIISEIEVDETTFKRFQEKEMLIKELLVNYRWQSTAIKNIAVAKRAIETQSRESIEEIAKLVDYKKFMIQHETLRGYPVRLSGQVLEVIKEGDYYRITIDTHIFEEPVLVFSTEAFDINKRLKLTGIFLGVDELLTFYGIK